MSFFVAPLVALAFLVSAPIHAQDTSPEKVFADANALLEQVYQALGDDKARDTEREELLALHNAGKDTSSLASRKDFCREQYRLGNRSVLVYEPFVFAPRTTSGSFAVRYQFYVLDEKDQLETRIEVGWDFPEKDKKGVWQPAGAYYFDAYYPTGPWVRRTMGLAAKELSYADTKAHIQAILEGKVKPSGGTPRNTPKDKSGSQG